MSNIMDKNKKKKVIASVLFGVGGATLVTGVTLIALALTKKEKEIDNRISVTFDVQDASIESGSTNIKLEQKTKFCDINKPTIFKNGYLIENWYKDKEFKNLVSPDEIVSESSTFYAKFVEDTKFYVEFKAGDTGAHLIGNTKVAIQRGQTFATINRPIATAEFKKFMYWTNGGIEVKDTDILNEGTILIPKFDPEYEKKAHVVFKARDDDFGVTFTGLTEFEVAAGTIFQTCTKPVASKPGKIFNSWVMKNAEGKYVPFEEQYALPAGGTVAYANFADVVLDQKIYCVLDGEKMWLTNPTDLTGDLVFMDTNGKTKPIAREEFNEEIIIGEGVDSVDINFLYGCTKFNNGAKTAEDRKPLLIPKNTWRICDSFLHGCEAFNQEIKFTEDSELTTVGASFLHKCYAFNQKITFPNKVTKIGSNFLFECKSFNSEIVLDANLNLISGSFLEGCSNFNTTLSLPSNIKSIDSYFLARCSSFNQALTIPDSVTFIGDDFLYSCEEFNSTLSLPKNESEGGKLEIIKDSFMESCYKFNQTLTLPDTLTEIGCYFMDTCYAFNQALTLPSSKSLTIGDYFMCEDKSFDQNFTVPANITYIGQNFLSRCDSMSKTTQKTVTIKIKAEKFHPNSVKTKEYTLATGDPYSSVKITGITVNFIIDGSASSTEKTNWLNLYPDTSTANNPPYRNIY